MPALKQEPPKTAPARAAGRKANPIQPVEGRIDYKAMRQDLIAAFPKTLARLAE